MSNKANPLRPRKLLGIDETSVPTSQAGLPYTYFAGVRALPVSWIMNPVIAFQTGTHVAPKKDATPVKFISGSPSAYLTAKGTQDLKRQSNLVFGHCAGRICLGQIDFIWGIMINNGLAWPLAAPWFPSAFLAGSIVARSGRLYKTSSLTSAIPPASPWTLFKTDLIAGTTPNPLKITIPTYGDTYLYYGTADQTLDTTNEKVLDEHDHPAYRNQTVLVLKLFQFGADTFSPPGITVLAGRKPVQSLITGSATDFDADWQVNPWCVLAELLTHPILGLGLPSSWFDATTWQAEADRCAANPQLYYISPMYTSLRKVRELVSDLLSYPDAFVFWSTVGILTAGHWPHGEAAPSFTGSNTIDRNDLIEEILWDTDTFDGTANSITVNFQDIQAAFKDRPVTASNLFNQTVTRRVQARSIDRPHIVRIKQAAAWASEAVKLYSDQTFKGTLKVQAEKATSVSPGSIFLLTDDALAVSVPQRCTKKVIHAAPAGAVTLTHEVERGVSPTPYSATHENPEAAQGELPGRIASYQLFQMPPALAGVRNAIGLLAARPNEFTSFVDTYFKYADSVGYQPLKTQRSFGVQFQVGTKAGQRSQVDLFPSVNIGTVGSSGYVEFTQPNCDTATVVVEYYHGGAWHTAIPWNGSRGYTLISVSGFFPTGGVMFDPATPDIATGDDVRITYLWQPQVLAASSYSFPGVFVTAGTNYSIGERWVWDVVVTYISGGTHTAVEGTDYLVDYLEGVITPITGGAIAGLSTGSVSVSYHKSLLAYLNPTTPDSDLDSISSSLTDDEAFDNKLIMVAFKDANVFEIASVRSLTALGDGYYAVTAIRERYATLQGGDGAYVFSNDTAFVAFSNTVLPITNQVFETLQLAGAAADFLLAPGNDIVKADLADIYDAGTNPTGLTTAASYTFAQIYPPTSTLVSVLRGNVQITNFTTTNFTTTDVNRIVVQIDDPSGDVNHVTLTADQGTNRILLLSRTLPESRQQIVDTQFTLPMEGVWTIKSTVTDASGNTTETELVEMHVRNVGYPLPSPVLYGKQVIGKVVANVIFSAPTTFGGTAQSGLVAKYQLVTRGQPYTGSWTTVSGSPTPPSGRVLFGPIPAFRSGQYTLYAKITKSGSSDSQVVSWNL